MGIFRKKRYVQHHEVAESFSLMKKDVTSLMQWIHWLKGRHEEHVTATQTRHADLRGRIQELRDDNAMLKERMRHMLEYMKLLHGEVKQLHEDVHSPQELPASLLEDEQHYRQAEVPEEPVTPEVPLVVAEGLTSAENKMVSVLVSSDTPMTYSDISQMLGISYGTAKNRVMTLKKKGVDLHFSTDFKGQRQFFLPQTEKIRISGR